TLLTFRPQVIIATAQGKQVDGFQIAAQLKKNRSGPRLMLVQTGSRYSKSSIPEGVDLLIESPISAAKIIGALGQFGDFNQEALLEKYARMKGQLSVDETEELNWLKYEQEAPAPETTENSTKETTIPLQFSKSDTLTAEERSLRYSDFLRKM